jgi:hypothetical protein
MRHRNLGASGVRRCAWRVLLQQMRIVRWLRVEISFIRRHMARIGSEMEELRLVRVRWMWPVVRRHWLVHRWATWHVVGVVQVGVAACSVVECLEGTAAAVVMGGAPRLASQP